MRRGTVEGLVCLTLAACSNEPINAVDLTKPPTPIREVTEILTESITPAATPQVFQAPTHEAVLIPTATFTPIPTNEPDIPVDRIRRDEAVVSSFSAESQGRVVFEQMSVAEEEMSRVKKAVGKFKEEGCSGVLTLNESGAVVIPATAHCLFSYDGQTKESGFFGHPDYRWFPTLPIGINYEWDFSEVGLIDSESVIDKSILPQQATPEEIESLRPNDSVAVINYQANRSEKETIYDAQLPVVGVTEKRIILAEGGFLPDGTSLPSLAKGGSQGPVFILTPEGDLKVAGVLSHLIYHGNPEFNQYQGRLGFSSEGTFNLGEFVRVDAGD